MDNNESLPAPDTVSAATVPEKAASTATIMTEDINWKAFREARKKDREEKEAAERKAAEKAKEVEALKAAMEAAFAKEQPKGKGGGYEEESGDEEERIRRHIDAALAAREAAYERERAEREKREFPQKLQRDFSDFRAIVTEENLDYFEYHYPEIARPLKRLPEGYDKWFDTYHAIKRLMPGAADAKKDAAKAQANSIKPQSASKTGYSQSTDYVPGGQLSEDRKAANWARMQRAMRSV